VKQVAASVNMTRNGREWSIFYYSSITNSRYSHSMTGIFIVMSNK